MEGVVAIASLGLLVLSAWENGPVSVEMEVGPEDLTVADRLTVEIRATVPRASLERALETGRDRLYALEPPTEPFSRLDGFRFLGMRTVEERTGGDRIRTVTRIDLEPRLPGAWEIPSLQLVFWPDSSAGKPVLVRTEAVPVAVRAIVPGDPLEAVPRPVMAELPRGGGSGAVLALVLAVIVALLWFFRDRFRFLFPRVELVPAPPGPGRRDAALAGLAASNEPRRWHAILLDYLAAEAGVDLRGVRFEEIRGDERITAGNRALLVSLLRDLEAAMFSREGHARPRQLRQRLRQFIRTADL